PLSDDCFAFSGDLLTVDQALALLAERIVPVCGIEDLPLPAAAGCVLAEDVVAPFPVPPHDNAAVDGYALYVDDLAPAGETRLPVVGRAAAGHPLDGPARRGTAVRIFTGAAMPGGAGGGPGPDSVMMQEDCRVEGDTVLLPAGLKRGANRRSAGEDLRQGQAALHAGTRLDAPAIGIAASVGRTSLRVYRPLRVAVFSTGDEVREPGQPLDPGTIYDSNRFALLAALRRLGCAATDLGILPDREAAIRDALAAAAEDHDLLVSSGGMSEGEEDHVKAAVETLGALRFWRLAIKPGRPVALGRVRRASGGAVPFAGLPGNPVAVMVTFMLIARPLVLRLSGQTDIAFRRYPVRAGFAHRKAPGRREFLRARLRTDSDTGLVAERHGRAGSGILSSLVGADGLVDLPEALDHLEAGMTVQFIPFSEVMP
ncbi:MAG: gephyrin-like molybdotransferase Glp, partial [Alphaproteobacteria bacterium]